MRYNGYKNHSTYVAVSWLLNDQELFRELRGKTEKEIRDAVYTGCINMLIHPVRQPGSPAALKAAFSAMVNDLVSAKLDEIDWSEIAGAINDG